MNAIGKQYKCVGNNQYEENSQGACTGAEWQDDNGNTFRMLWAYCPTFNPSAEYAEMLYMIFVKPVGVDDWCFVKEVIEPLGSDSFFCNNPTIENFGKEELSPFLSEGVLKEGIATQVQFFIDNFIINKYNLPVSFKKFIYQFISNYQGITII